MNLLRLTTAIIQGDALEVLRTLPDGSVQCVVTSPPYWGLRDYGVDGQLGLEKTPQEYLDKMVAIFEEVRRVLRDDGTAWVNMGDSYAASGMGGNPDESTFRKQATNARSLIQGRRAAASGLKPKDLCGIPWRLALALQAAGWYLRCDIIWSKPNPMPESVTDRPTKAHEYIFLLSKSERYFYDAEAVKEKTESRYVWKDQPYKCGNLGIHHKTSSSTQVDEPSTRNLRSVWTIPTHPFPEAHFATFPPALAEKCIKAGSKDGDTILDPFSGAGTTGLVAQRLGRNFIGIELNGEYVEMSRRRIAADMPLFQEATP